MPAVRLLGRRWQVSTDLLPLFALVAVIFYLCWFIYIVVAFFITVNVHGCNDTSVGRHYLAVVCLFFTEYVVSLLTALCILAIGLQGMSPIYAYRPECYSTDDASLNVLSSRLQSDSCGLQLRTSQEPLWSRLKGWAWVLFFTYKSATGRSSSEL